MKSAPIILTLAALVIVGGIGYGFLRDQESGRTQELAASEKPSALDAVEAKNRPVIEIDDFVAKPESFSGEIVLKAVVAGVTEDASVFGVIDAREFEECGVLSCAKNVVPVKFNGEIPALETIVNITGEVVRRDEGLVFEAKAVDVVK
jgi:hypothetical protein